MSEPYLGEIRLFAGDYAPVGWNFCDGTKLPVSEHEALFSLIGAAWGGDGKTDFALPDLRGRVVIGSGAGAGLAPRTLAQTGGEEKVAITGATLARHTHAFNVTAQPATSKDPKDRVLGAVKQAGTVNGFYSKANLAASAVTVQVMDPNMLDFAGGNGQAKPGANPHENTMPSAAINYIIAISGSYPPLNPNP